MVPMRSIKAAGLPWQIASRCGPTWILRASLA